MMAIITIPDICERRWKALAGPVEFIRIVAERTVEDRTVYDEVCRIYRGNNTTQAEAIATQIINDHNTIVGIVEAARGI